MTALCGANCDACGYGKQTGCKGCADSNGCPFGTPCFIARYIQVGGKAAYEAFVQTLIDECNALNIPGMPPITALSPLNGAYVNLTYPLPGGAKAAFLDDNAIYLATQAECLLADEQTCRCFGIVANAEFILVAEYGENGADPELILFKKR